MGSWIKYQKCRLRLQRQLITTAHLRRVRFRIRGLPTPPSGATQLHDSCMSSRNTFEAFYIIVWTPRIKPELLDHVTTVSLRSAIQAKRSSLGASKQHGSNKPTSYRCSFGNNMVFARWSTIFQSSSVRCKLKNAIKVGV